MEIKDQGKGARDRVLVGNVGGNEKWEKSAANRVYVTKDLDSKCTIVSRYMY